MKMIVFFPVCCLMLIKSLQAQPERTLLLTEKPGTFKLQKEALNGQWLDAYGKSCACSNTESDAMLGELEKLVQVFRKAPVLNDIKGFDGICRLYGGRCSSKFSYAVPTNLKFWFRSWSLRKAVEAQWVNEPPQWIIEVNQADKFRDNGFNVSDYSNSSGATNPAFSEKAASAAAIALNEIFYQPGVREMIQPGIDRYGDDVVVYNPGRPPYWEQVTVREAFRLLINYWKCVPDIRQAVAMVPVLEKELANFSEEQKDGHAYFGDPETISRIGSKENDTPVLRCNPAYWDRNRPKASVQLIVFEMPKPEVVKSKMENCLKNADGYYYLYKLMSELDIKSLTTFVTQ